MQWQVSRKYFKNAPVDPHHFIADQTEQMLTVANNSWTEKAAKYTFFLLCYPHIRVNIRKKRACLKFGKKQDDRLEEFQGVIHDMYHYAGSVDMFKVLADAAYYMIYVTWNEKRCATWFYNQYCTRWNCWALCMVEIAGVWHMILHRYMCCTVKHVSYCNNMQHHATACISTKHSSFCQVACRRTTHRSRGIRLPSATYPHFCVEPQRSALRRRSHAWQHSTA